MYSLWDWKLVFFLKIIPILVEQKLMYVYIWKYDFDKSEVRLVVETARNRFAFYNFTSTVTQYVTGAVDKRV